ncbi:MAG TPA: sensor histidine kinase [Niastella sp.]
MKETAVQEEKSSYPLIYEGMVWVLYTALYKYAHYLSIAKMQRTYDNFPHLQLMVYALVMTVYVIPFYRWLAPALLNRNRYGWLILCTLAWFLFIPKISNVCVSWLFMSSNGAGAYKAFYTTQFLMHKIQAVHLRGWDFQVLLTDLIAFSSVAITRFAFDNERKKRLLEKDIFRLQLDALNTQLNPHFLFNTLNSIYGMSLTGSKDTPQYVLRLADMMRYTLYDCREGKVELEKDIGFTENFVAMEKKRYPLSDIRFTISNNSEGVFIAPLLLIPFIENSFKHGAHRLNDRGFIHAHLEASTQTLHFMVENDILVSTVPHPGSGGIGIENVKKRLQMYYPGKHELKIENTGTTFTVVLTILFK